MFSVSSWGPSQRKVLTLMTFQLARLPFYGPYFGNESRTPDIPVDPNSVSYLSSQSFIVLYFTCGWMILFISLLKVGDLVCDSFLFCL